MGAARAAEAALTWAGALAVLGAAAWVTWLALGEGNLGWVALAAAFAGFALMALVGHLRGSPLQVAGALLVAAFSVLLVFSFGSFFLPGALMLFAGSAFALRDRVGWRAAALIAGLLGVLPALPTLATLADMVLDPCATVTVEPWGATSGGGSSAPSSGCPKVRGTILTLDRLVALVALAGGGVSALTSAWPPARRGGAFGGLAAFAVVVATLSPGTFPLAVIALLAAVVLALGQREALGPRGRAA